MARQTALFLSIFNWIYRIYVIVLHLCVFYRMEKYVTNAQCVNNTEYCLESFRKCVHWVCVCVCVIKASTCVQMDIECRSKNRMCMCFVAFGLFGIEKRRGNTLDYGTNTHTHTFSISHISYKFYGFIPSNSICYQRKKRKSFIIMGRQKKKKE